VSQPTPPPIDQLFHQMVKNGASDLHLCVGSVPMVRKDGHMQALDAAAAELTGEALVQLLAPIMPEKNRKEYTDRAMGMVSRAVAAGFTDAAYIRADKDLDALETDLDGDARDGAGRAGVGREEARAREARAQGALERRRVDVRGRVAGGGDVADADLAQ